MCSWRKLYFQQSNGDTEYKIPSDLQMVPQTQTNNADMYPPFPVGVGTDPAIAPVAIATASGVAVPPPGRQKRRAMDAMTRDAAIEMPKIPQQHLVVGSRVEGTRPSGSARVRTAHVAYYAYWMSVVQLPWTSIFAIGQRNMWSFRAVFMRKGTCLLLCRGTREQKDCV